MARATMARAYLIMLAVMGALVKRALSQSANQGWMYGVKNNDPKFYLYNPTIDPPIGPIEFDPWPTGAPAGSWNANDLMDGIAMDSTNNQLIFPKCRMPCSDPNSCFYNCISCDMWSYDIVTGALNKFLSNWPPCAEWMTTFPVAPTNGAFIEGGWVTVQYGENRGLNSDEAYMWYLPMTFNAATKTYTPGAIKRYILKASTCPTLSTNAATDLAYNTVTKEAFLGSQSAGCDLMSFDASTLATAANNSVINGAEVKDFFRSYYMAMDCNNVLYGNDCFGFSTVDQTTGVATAVPGTSSMSVCWDLAGSACGACPLNAPAEVCGPGPGPGPTPGGCNAVNHAYASTSPSGKVAPFRVFTYSATLVNSRTRASARQLAALQGGAQAQVAKFPSSFVNASFAITLPAGVTMQSGASSPKVATQPAYNNATGMVTWQLGHLKSGSKIRVSLKLVAAACSTPAPLALDGKFSYFTTAGLQTVDACLKKDLYAWSKTCAPIPKGGKTPTGGMSGGKTVGACTCSICECDAKGCLCPPDCCTMV